MSYWYSTEKQREVYNMRQRYMSNILQYNKQQIEDKARRKQLEFRTFNEHSQQINQQAINELLAESNRNLRKREQEKNMLKESYERQIRERNERQRMEKERDVVYAHRQRERLDYEEERRMFEISKMFNRVSYQATPGHTHRRVKTEGYDEHESNPQRHGHVQASTPKNLNNIQINLLPPGQSQALKTVEGDSLDDLNYSFHKRESLKKY